MAQSSMRASRAGRGDGAWCLRSWPVAGPCLRRADVGRRLPLPEQHNGDQSQQPFKRYENKGDAGAAAGKDDLDSHEPEENGCDDPRPAAAPAYWPMPSAPSCPATPWRPPRQQHGPADLSSADGRGLWPAGLRPIIVDLTPGGGADTMAGIHARGTTSGSRPGSGRAGGLTGPLDDQLITRLLYQRIIVLGTEVDDRVANRLCAQLLLLSAEDRAPTSASTSTARRLGDCRVGDLRHHAADPQRRRDARAGLRREHGAVPAAAGAKGKRCACRTRGS